MGNIEINSQEHYQKTFEQKSKEQKKAYDYYSILPDFISTKELIELEKAAKTNQILSDSKVAREELKNDIQAENKDGEDSEDKDRQTRVCELSQEEFVSRLKEISEDIYSKYGAPHPMVIIGQALHETGIGKSGVAKNKNNLFGFRLKNEKRGVFEYIRYTSMEEACEAYADKMVNSKIYSKALQYKNEPKKYIAALIKAGYSSTPPSEYIARVEGCLNKFGWSLDDKIEEA